MEAAEDLVSMRGKQCLGARPQMTASVPRIPQLTQLSWEVWPQSCRETGSVGSFMFPPRQANQCALFLFHIFLHKLITPEGSGPHCVRGRLRPPGAWHRVLRKCIRDGSFCFWNTLLRRAVGPPCLTGLCCPQAGWPRRDRGLGRLCAESRGSADRRGEACFSQPAFCSLCILKGKKSRFLSWTTLFGICQRNLWWLRQ